MSRKEAILLNNLFPARSLVDDEIWSPRQWVILTTLALEDLRHWIRSTNGNLRKRFHFFGFLSLIKLIEAIALYDKVIIYGYSDDVVNKLVDAGAVVDPEYQPILMKEVFNISMSGLPAYRIRFSPIPFKDSELELIEIAKEVYPKSFAEERRYAESIHEAFVDNVYATILSHSTRLPLIPSRWNEIECMLIARELLTHQVLSVSDMVYYDAVEDINSVIHRICVAQGRDGVILTPVVYNWLKMINRKSIETYDEMIDVALDIREQLSKTRDYLRELSYTLCDYSGSFSSHKKAKKRIVELRKALVELADPDGERVFLFRLADLKGLAPSLKALSKIDNPTSLLKELALKPLEWWLRRLRYRNAFHIFALFDDFLNSKNVTQEIFKFTRSDLEMRHIQWAKHREKKFKNTSNMRLTDDAEVTINLEMMDE